MKRLIVCALISRIFAMSFGQFTGRLLEEANGLPLQLKG
jgi:hypothetical protein